MSLFQDLVALFTQATDIRDQYTGVSIEEMLDYIRTEDELRFYVDGSLNYGHQATTVNIMKRIINTAGYTGNIVVYYAGETKTADKLAILLPGLNPLNIDTAIISYGSCTNITFKPF